MYSAAGGIPVKTLQSSALWRISISVQTGGSSCPYDTINNSHTSFIPVNRQCLHCLRVHSSSAAYCLSYGLLKPLYGTFLLAGCESLPVFVSFWAASQGWVRHSCVDEHTHTHKHSWIISAMWRITNTEDRPKHGLWNRRRTCRSSGQWTGWNK